MRKSIFAILITVAVFTTTAFAKDKDKDRHDRKSSSSFREHDKHLDRAKDHDRADARDHVREREHDRDRHHVASGRPAGWNKGKKTGWGDCNVPPGQAKKSGCGEAKVAHQRREHDRHIDRHSSNDWHRPATTTASAKPSPVINSTSGRPSRSQR